MRVISGALRGRRFSAPKRGVRPTADRIRESLFALVGDVTDASVLDLFAGSGALGIEALSRGASNAVFVEQAPASVTVVKRNLAELGLTERGRVLRGDVRRVLRSLARERARFDLVLADPPYTSGVLDWLLHAIAEAGVVLPSGTLVVERGRRHPVPPVPGLRLLEHREYGDTVITRFTACESGGPHER